MSNSGKPMFPGGIHPTDGSDKAQTMDMPSRLFQPETVTILSEQTPGGTCEFLVRPGERVREGQRIAKPQTFLAAPLHASVTGTVTDIRETEYLGRKMKACIIRREEELRSDPAPYTSGIEDISGFCREELIRGLCDGGLTGMGGAGFPTYRKYETDRHVDTLLINGAECEPFLTCDYRLMMEEGFSLINGIRLLLKASGADRAVLCIEENKPAAAGQLRELLETARAQGSFPESGQLEICVLPVKYPQGGERQLIQAVLEREVPAGGLPADVGVIVSNVGTAKAAADQILGGHPLTRRLVTVAGCVKEPANYLVPVGTSAGELLAASGGITEPQSRIVAGGPMTGPCVSAGWNGTEALFHVTKSTSGILVLPEPYYEEQPCIRCGGCQSVCPAGLTPYQIEFAFLEGDYDLCEKLYAGECIACGCCSYICPAKRELSYRTRMARDIVKQRMRERKVKNA